MKCAICARQILWKDCRVTNDGQLAHEECLASKLKDK